MLLYLSHVKLLTMSPVISSFARERIEKHLCSIQLFHASFAQFRTIMFVEETIGIYMHNNTQWHALAIHMHAR